MRRAIVAFLVIGFACAANPGPLPEVLSPAEQADDKKDWFPTNSERPLPLDVAIQAGNLSEVRRLLEAGGNPNARWLDSGDRFPLQQVLEARQYRYRIDDPTEIIRLLLKHGADPNAKWCPPGTRDGWLPQCRSAKAMTPLMSAAFYGPPDVVQLLLEAGADAAVRNWQGGSALDYAVDEVAFEMIGRSLFPDLATRNQKALEWLNRNVTERDPRTPLVRAIGLASGSARRSDTSMIPYLSEGEGRALSQVRTMLRIGADPNERMRIVPDSNVHGDWTPLAIALWERALRVARVLLQNGADVNQRWCSRFRPVWSVPGTTSTELKVGRDPACTPENGITPLMLGAAVDDREIVDLLLEFRADQGLKDWAGRTALDYASTRGMKELLAAGRGF